MHIGDAFVTLMTTEASPAVSYYQGFIALERRSLQTKATDITARK